jgi:hypothetical protein
MLQKIKVSLFDRHDPNPFSKQSQAQTRPIRQAQYTSIENSNVEIIVLVS